MDRLIKSGGDDRRVAARRFWQLSLSLVARMAAWEVSMIFNPFGKRSTGPGEPPAPQSDSSEVRGSFGKKTQQRQTAKPRSQRNSDPMALPLTGDA
ncbi:hypothetical protein J2S22_003081 [Rhodoplanes tepidamans]|nr:hypothetical protein [Rhodoplanes tepidamans]